MLFTIGMLSILGLMMMVYLGPEIVVQLAGKPRRLRKRVRICIDSRLEPLAGKRRIGRPGPF